MSCFRIHSNVPQSKGILIKSLQTNLVCIILRFSLLYIVEIPIYHQILKNIQCKNAPQNKAWNINLKATGVIINVGGMCGSLGFARRPNLLKCGNFATKCGICFTNKQNPDSQF